MSVKLYPKALVVFLLVLFIGFVAGGWSVAAVWRVGAVVAVVAIIVERIHAMRLHSRHG